MTSRFYRQTTYETCLACALFYSVKIKPTKNRELKVINYSLRFSKNSFALGHLEYFTRKYNRKLKLFLESKTLFSSWSKIKFNKKIDLVHAKINLDFVSKNLKYGPVILYLDCFVFQNNVHYPHYIVLIDENAGKYKLYDPWDGKIKRVEKKIISKGIQKLRNHLLFSPQLIRVDPK
ncbi:MAG: hypothetical protein HYW26_02360 [Candidatus Aenigmarchaeota archaeon]|nr:hypothetical protein [Candidatus Aenigmarchaeota archaeon]